MEAKEIIERLEKIIEDKRLDNSGIICKTEIAKVIRDFEDDEFRNEVYKGNVVYEKSKLFDWNVSNAITRKDKSENEMLDKANKNKQRIDLIAATIFAFSQVYQQEEDWAIQVI